MKRVGIRKGINFTDHAQRQYFILTLVLINAVAILNKYELPEARDKKLVWMLGQRIEKILLAEQKALERDREWIKNNHN